MQLITALANDVKLLHPHTVPSGREDFMRLSSFQLSTPSVVQHPVKKLQFSSKKSGCQVACLDSLLVNSVTVSGTTPGHRQHAYLQDT